MTRAVVRFDLDLDHEWPQTLQVPFGARPIAVERDDVGGGRYLRLWFEGDPEADTIGLPLWLIDDEGTVPGGLVHLWSCRGLHIYTGKKQ